MPITVVVAERMARRRASLLGPLRREAGLRVLGDTRSGGETLAATATLRPQVLVLGSSVAPRDVPVMLALVRHRSRDTRVVVLGREGGRRRPLDALGHGARGWLDASADSATVARAVRAVAAGQAWVPRAMVARLVPRLQAPPPSGPHPPADAPAGPRPGVRYPKVR